MKATGALPFGQMPVLRVGGADGVLLGQSTAICRYVAKLADPALELYPSDPVSAALVDGILMQDDDMRTGFCKLCDATALCDSYCCRLTGATRSALNQTPSTTLRGMDLKKRSKPATPTPRSLRPCCQRGRRWSSRRFSAPL
eukprot:COSAG02_NODE_7436_length_3014_cov_2.413722_1_plen_142_part_00